MDKEQILKYLSTLPLWAKIVVIIVITLLSVVTLCSCGTSIASQLPSIKDNKLSAEGVVSKEKNITKQTKWYFKPESENSNYIE